MCKYIANCASARGKRAKLQMYPLQMMDIPDQPFNKIAIDLVTDLNASTSGNEHILTIIDHLIGWLEAFPIPYKMMDTIVYIFINNYLPVHMCPKDTLSDNGIKFKNQLMDNVLQQLGIDCIFSTHRAMEKWRYSTDTSNPHSRNCVRMTRTSGTNTSAKYLPVIV